MQFPRHMYINMVLLSTVAFVAIEQCNSGLRIDEEKRILSNTVSQTDHMVTGRSFLLKIQQLIAGIMGFL